MTEFFTNTLIGFLALSFIIAVASLFAGYAWVVAYSFSNINILVGILSLSPIVIFVMYSIGEFISNQ